MNGVIQFVLFRTLAVASGGGLGWFLFEWAGFFVGASSATAMVWVVDGVFVHRLARALMQVVEAEDFDVRPYNQFNTRWPAMSRRLWDIASKGLQNRDRLSTHHRLRLVAFQQAIQNSPMGVVLLDDQNRIEWCNQTAAIHFGFDAARDQLQHVAHLIRLPVFTSYLNSGHWDDDLVMPGRRIHIDTEVRLAVRLHAYSLGAKLMLSRDVTALENASAMRRDFVANVSHEIRTPLTVLSGFIETLQTLALEPDEQRRYLGLMHSQSIRMKNLVSDLLTLSQLDGVSDPARERRFDVNEVLFKIEQTIAVDVGLKREVALDLQFSGSLMASQSEFESAVTNLLVNALRYTPDDRLIYLATALRSTGELAVWVQDEGGGIAVEHLGRLTERFYRVDKSRSRDTGGTGLGLAIVKHVMQRHAGRMEIKSAVGAGSTFTLVWPAPRVWPHVGAEAVQILNSQPQAQMNEAVELLPTE